MGQRLNENLDNFSGGVVTSLKPDVIPSIAGSLGYNSALTYVGADIAALSKRKGLTTLGINRMTSTPAVIGQYQFKRRSGETLTAYHLLVGDNGHLDKLSAGTYTNLSTALDSTSPNPPDFATANNLAFIVNGTDKVKFDGTTVTAFGITAPPSPTLGTGGAGGMTGNYQVALTYYNSSTGAESSRSPLSTIALAAQKLTVTFAAASDPQVDYVRIHILKTTISSLFFQVVTGTGIVTTNDINGWVDTAGTVTLDLSDADLLAQIILTPDTEENNPPPTGIRYLCWHQSRMFAADSANLFYSKVGLPESFDPDFEEHVNPDDGELITGLHSAGGILLIFKQAGIYGLFGDDPNSWFVRQLDNDTGCTSHRSIVTIEGATYFWSRRGPCRLADSPDPSGGVGTPETIGQSLILPTISETALAYGSFGNVVAAASLTNQRVIFGVAGHGQTRNNILLPFSYRAQRFEATLWDPMDAASLASMEDSNGIPFVSLGSYAGEALQMESGDDDALGSNTDTGTFTASGTSVSTITSTGFVASSLIERKVSILDSDGVPVARRRITANSTTVLTLDSAVTVVNAASYSWVVAGPDFRWETRWGNFEQPLLKKRFEYLFIDTEASAGVFIDLDLAVDFNDDYGQSKLMDLTGASALWDADVWDHASYGTKQFVHKRLRIGRTGRQWKLRIRQPDADAPVTIRRIALAAEAMTTKS